MNDGMRTVMIAVAMRNGILELLEWVDGLDEDEAVEVPHLRDRLSFLRAVTP